MAHKNISSGWKGSMFFSCLSIIIENQINSWILKGKIFREPKKKISGVFGGSEANRKNDTQIQGVQLWAYRKNEGARSL